MTISFSLPNTGTLIEGAWLAGTSCFAVPDRYSGEIVGEVSASTREEVARAVQAASRAFAGGAPAAHERARILYRTRDLVAENRHRFVELIVAETGFTTADADGDVTRALMTLEHSADEAKQIVGEMVPFAGTPGQEARIGFTIRVPVGVVCAITPFNSPLNTPLHKIAPAFAAGNAVVFKPSQLTPLTGALLCELLLEAGLPPGFISLVQGDGETVGNWLLEEQDIAFYTFTGSTRVGKHIAAAAAAGLRRTQLELGSVGSTVVFNDANLEKAIPRIANAGFRKAGQVCTSTQLLFVEADKAEEVTERLIAQARSMPVGDPRDPSVRVGPMIEQRHAERAESWIDEAVGQGARLRLGGQRHGAQMPLTVLDHVSSGMKLIDEEAFCPVISVIPFTDIAQAMTGANRSPYGLSAGVFTGDLTRAMAAARSIRVGAVHINEASSSRADVMPFGGVKDSGFGREGPRYAIREMTEERLVTFNP